MAFEYQVKYFEPTVFGSYVYVETYREEGAYTVNRTSAWAGASSAKTTDTGTVYRGSYRTSINGEEHGNSVFERIVTRGFVNGIRYTTTYESAYDGYSVKTQIATLVDNDGDIDSGDDEFNTNYSTTYTRRIEVTHDLSANVISYFTESAWDYGTTNNGRTTSSTSFEGDSISTAINYTDYSTSQAYGYRELLSTETIRTLDVYSMGNRYALTEIDDTITYQLRSTLAISVVTRTASESYSTSTATSSFTDSKRDFTETDISYNGGSVERFAVMHHRTVDITDTGNIAWKTSSGMMLGVTLLSFDSVFTMVDDGDTIYGASVWQLFNTPITQYKSDLGDDMVIIPALSVSSYTLRESSLSTDGKYYPNFVTVDSIEETISWFNWATRNYTQTIHTYITTQIPALQSKGNYGKEMTIIDVSAISYTQVTATTYMDQFGNWPLENYSSSETYGTNSTSATQSGGEDSGDNFTSSMSYESYYWYVGSTVTRTQTSYAYSTRATLVDSFVGAERIAVNTCCLVYEDQTPGYLPFLGTVSDTLYHDYTSSVISETYNTEDAAFLFEFPSVSIGRHIGGQMKRNWWRLDAGGTRRYTTTATKSQYSFTYETRKPSFPYDTTVSTGYLERVVTIRQRWQYPEDTETTGAHSNYTSALLIQEAVDSDGFRRSRAVQYNLRSSIPSDERTRHSIIAFPNTTKIDGSAFVGDTSATLYYGRCRVRATIRYADGSQSMTIDAIAVSLSSTSVPAGAEIYCHAEPLYQMVHNSGDTSVSSSYFAIDGNNKEVYRE